MVDFKALLPWILESHKDGWLATRTLNKQQAQYNVSKGNKITQSKLAIVSRKDLEQFTICALPVSILDVWHHEVDKKDTAKLIKTHQDRLKDLKNGDKALAMFKQAVKDSKEREHLHEFFVGEPLAIPTQDVPEIFLNRYKAILKEAGLSSTTKLSLGVLRMKRSKSLETTRLGNEWMVKAAYQWFFVNYRDNVIG